MEPIMTIQTGRTGLGNDDPHHVDNCTEGYRGNNSCGNAGRTSCLTSSDGGDYRTCKYLPANTNNDFQVHQIGPGGDNI